MFYRTIYVILHTLFCRFQSQGSCEPLNRLHSTLHQNHESHSQMLNLWLAQSKSCSTMSPYNSCKISTFSPIHVCVTFPLTQLQILLVMIIIAKVTLLILKEHLVDVQKLSSRMVVRIFLERSTNKKNTYFY